MGEWIGAPRENYTPQGSCGWGLSQIPMGSSAQLPGVLSAGQAHSRGKESLPEQSPSSGSRD